MTSARPVSNDLQKVVMKGFFAGKLCYILFMAEENPIVNNTEASQPQEPESFDLADDILQLEKLNLMRAVMLRLQGGKHPTGKVDALLKRRMTFPEQNFQGPYAVRLACTLMMIFVMVGILWAVLWGLAVHFEFSYFIRVVSTGFATVIAAIAGVAVFHPSSIPDEKLVRAAIKGRLEDLNKQLAAQKAKLAEESEVEPVVMDESTTTDDSAAAASQAALSENGNMTNKPPEPINEALALEGSDDILT